MELLDPEKLQLFFLFTVPGMVALYVRAQFLDGRMPGLGDGITVYVALSLLYHAAWFTASPEIYAVTLSTATTCQKVGWIALLFIGPVILGILSGLNVQKQWLKHVLERIGLKTMHPVASAWDWHFSKVAESWVLVILKDGTKWGGLLGPKSFISSSSSERDIFIEKVYFVHNDGKWEERSSSVLISPGEVQTIEFWPKGP